MKSNEKIMTAIKHRGDLSDPFVTVGKILEAGGMENWTGLCCDRIADAELIDMENVRIDFENIGDLVLSVEGLVWCREILLCYVSRDIWTSIYKLLCLEESARYSINEVARILREMRWCDLFRVCMGEDEKMRRYAAMEIRQRLCLAGYREKVRRLYCDIVVRVKYRRLISVCKEIGMMNGGE